MPDFFVYIKLEQANYGIIGKLHFKLSVYLTPSFSTSLAYGFQGTQF